MSNVGLPLELEVEAKFTVSGNRLEQLLRGDGQLAGYSLRFKGESHLRSIYLDTAQWSLLRSGIALRLRRIRGRAGCELTAKWSGRLEGEVHERPEVTILLAALPRLPLRHLPAALAPHLAGVVAGRPLQSVLTTAVKRRCFGVYVGAGAKAQEGLELALDRVTVEDPNGRTMLRYREVELELRGGRRRDLHAVARVLEKQFGLRPSKVSKFERGLRTLYRRVPKFDSVRRQSAVAPELAATLECLRAQDAEVRSGLAAASLEQFRRCLQKALLLLMRRSRRSSLHSYLTLLETLARSQALLDLARQTPGQDPLGLWKLKWQQEAAHLAEQALNSPEYYAVLVDLERAACRSGVPLPRK